jgi:septin family protein
MVRNFLHDLSRLLPRQRRHSRVYLEVVITENGVRLRLNIVDTPGYGDQVNNENW